ncbi:MAG: DUF3795 domain-containing protein [Gemmatimonadota bacterium]|nr:MAG: DUF3795 domain-containing protein [Gemmatimonadota bacterium]
MTPFGTQAYDSVKPQIGYCGIWCGSCVVGNGALSELTRRYRKTTEAYDLGEWAPRDFDYSEFAQGLASIQAMPTCPGCRAGGGRDDCEIRTCARSRELDDCTKCGDFGKCEHQGILERMRTGAVDAGLMVRRDSRSNDELLREWSAEIERRWPCCVLFLEGE